MTGLTVNFRDQVERDVVFLEVWVEIDLWRLAHDLAECCFRQCRQLRLFSSEYLFCTDQILVQNKTANPCGQSQQVVSTTLVENKEPPASFHLDLNQLLVEAGRERTCL